MHKIDTGDMVVSINDAQSLKNYGYVDKVGKRHSRDGSVR